MPRFCGFWAFEVYALLREVNSYLQEWCYVCRRGFMPRFCGYSVFTLNSYKSSIIQLPHLGLRATQV